MSAAPARRIRATPYARRLARERGVGLDVLAGTGPEGRVTGADVLGFRVPDEVAPALEVPEAAHRASAPAAAPSAFAAEVDFTAALALLAEAGRPAVTHETVALKAAAVALEALALPQDGDGLVLVRGKNRQRLSGLGHRSLSGIAALAGMVEGGDAPLAVSFLARPGIRPVAARLEGGTAARLLVGFPGSEGRADCLLSFDPDRIEEDRAVEFLGLFKEWVETPLRLLV